jgi:hypothetical protein
VTILSASDFEFPREFAAFADYIGAADLHKSARKVMQKLAQFEAATRNLFGTRYFFHEEIERFADGSSPFQVDLSDPLSVRAASFIAGVNRARMTMSEVGAVRFRKMIIDNLKPDRDFRQIEHEVCCFIHFRQKLAKVQFADLDETGSFDLLCAQDSALVEVECKTISEDTGNPIKNEMLVNLTQQFLRSIRSQNQTSEPGIFLLTFKSEPSSSNAIVRELQSALRSIPIGRVDCRDAWIEFLPRPNWKRN